MRQGKPIKSCSIPSTPIGQVLPSMRWQPGKPLREHEQNLRKVCSGCGFIFYLNPKVVAAAVRARRTASGLFAETSRLQRQLDFSGGYVDWARAFRIGIRETYEETLLRIRLDKLLMSTPMRMLNCADCLSRHRRRREAG